MRHIDDRRLRHGLAYPSSGLLFMTWWGELLPRGLDELPREFWPQEDMVVAEHIYFSPMSIDEFRARFPFAQLVGRDWRGYHPSYPEAKVLWEWDEFQR